VSLCVLAALIAILDSLDLFLPVLLLLYDVLVLFAVDVQGLRVKQRASLNIYGSIIDAPLLLFLLTDVLRFLFVVELL
jgi:hypothetical protein